MRKKTKSILNSILFITICFLICGASLGYFFTDLNRTTVRTDKQIATIVFKKKIAQRKFSDSVVWERLQETSPLYNEDIIRTDVAAAAKLEFSDGDVSVDLDEKTMIQIFSGKNGELKIAVSGGNFTVDTTEATSAIKIDLGNSIINLEKGSRLSASNSDGNSSIVISEGTGVITNHEGEEEFILAGDTVKIDESGSKVKIPVTVTNLDVVQKYLVFEGQKQNVTFNLNIDSNYGSRRINFEASNTSDFAIVNTKAEISDSDSFTIDLIKGTYYYRFYPEEQVNDSFNGKIIVDEIKVPKLISPNHSFTYESVNVMPDINFVWDSGLYCDYCRLEIYDENDINNPVISQEVTGDSIKISSLNEGKYFWKIIPHYGINNIGFKDIVSSHKFEIVRQKLNLTPELSIPAAGSNIILGADDKDILFACKSDVKASEFRFEVSSDKDFNRDVVYSSIENNVRRSVPLSIKKLPKGTYFWRVVRIDQDKNEFFSSVRDFTVSEYIPKATQLVYPPENYSVERERLTATQFIWNLSESISKLKTQSVVEIAKDEAFTQIVQSVNSNGISYTGFNIPEGKYFWRVRAVDTAEYSEIEKTGSRVLNVIKPLDVPEIILPANNSTLTIYSGDAVKLSWKEIPESDYYVVKFIDEKNNTVISQYDSIKTNAVNVSLPSDKKIKCSVQAFCDEKENSPERGSKASEVSFNIKTFSKIRLVAPQNNARIEGLAALKKPVVFAWTEDTQEKKKEFVLTKLYPNGTTKVISSVNNPTGSVSVSRLTAGTYRWTVNAVTKEGFSVSPDNSFTFTVSQVPDLPAVKLNVPSDKFVIDIDYLRVNRTIRFNWSPVTGATDYNFVLYQRNPNGTLKRIVSENITETEYVFTDLKALDVGTFDWQVTAFTHAYDGFEEQKGIISSSSFVVNLDLPDTVKTKDPGKMYAE